MAKMINDPIGNALAHAIDLEQGHDCRLAEHVFADWLDERGDPRGEPCHA